MPGSQMDTLGQPVAWFAHAGFLDRWQGTGMLTASRARQGGSFLVGALQLEVFTLSIQLSENANLIPSNYTCPRYYERQKARARINISHEAKD